MEPAGNASTSAPSAGKATGAGSGGRKEVSLYAARATIYQREVEGPWQRRRTVVLLLLAALYLGTPWLTWEGRQAVWFDVPSRKFYLFELTFWPQDFIYLSGLMILGALSLFFFTNLAGRLWCGYACPQTVWTRFFQWIEWLVEGDRNRRILLDRQPWSARKLAIKSAKHAAWIFFACVVGVTFAGYFLPIRDLLPRMAAGSVGGSEAVFLAVASLALYADAGFMREQICKYACPYARFQGAMFDRATLTIFYDRKRGEPRGHRAKGSRQALGHCVDCKLCVHVCPTGIDIRNGTQYECIGCAACIDACDSVMTEVGFPKGLVRYTSESALDGNPRPLLRSRTVAYGCVILAVAGLWTWGMLHRMPVALDVLADRGRLYRMVSAGDIENVYTLKVMNKAQHPATYRLSAEGGFVLEGPDTLTVQPGEVKTLPVELRAARRALSAVSTPVAFTVESVANAKVKARAESRFLAPASAIGHGGEEHREAGEHAAGDGVGHEAGDPQRDGDHARDNGRGRDDQQRGEEGE